MTQNPGSYLEWWVQTYGGGTLLFIAPLSIPIGIGGIAAGAFQTDLELLGLGAVILLAGAFFIFGPRLQHWNRPKPWEESSQANRADRTPPQASN